MKRIIQLSLLAALAAAGPALGQSAPEIPFRADADFLELPRDTYLGEVAGVARNSRGHVFVYTRTGVPTAVLGTERTFYHGNSRLFEFDQDGKFVREIGEGNYSFDYAQQVRVDPEDNVWTVDAGSNVLLKFGPDGRFLGVLGRKPEAIRVRPGPGVPAREIDPRPAETGGSTESSPARGNRVPGAGTPGHNFSRPADVAFGRDGSVYVADGFGANDRIAQFDRDGNFVKSWGQTGSGPGEFDTIRGIAVDAAGNLYVADAGNRRIQVFDPRGGYRSEITGIGTPQAICITDGPTQYLYSSNSNDAESMENGEIYKLQLDGRVVGRFGHAGKVPGEFGMVNSLDCRSENELLVGEVWNWRAQKVTLGR